MKELIPFEIDKSLVRAFYDKDENWFVAADIIDLLQLQRNSLGKIKDEWKGVKNFNTPGGKQKMTVIKEPAVWKLAMRSNKPEAQRFQDWLAEDVIPSLRKQGYYDMTRENLKPTYKEIASDIFMKHPHKDSAKVELERIINMVNKAVTGMKSFECKEKHNISPRDYIRKHEPEKLEEYDRLQMLVKGEIERGRNILQIKKTIESMGYKTL